MGPILTPPNLRRASLLCLGLAGGLILSPGAHDSTAAMGHGSGLVLRICWPREPLRASILMPKGPQG